MRGACTASLPTCLLVWLRAPRASCFLVQMVEVAIDASEVPSDYILAILSQCSTFPEVCGGLGGAACATVHAALAVCNMQGLPRVVSCMW